MPLCGFNETMARGLSEFVRGLADCNTTRRKQNMPWCGFNQTMAGGLETFVEGLATQTEKRASEEGVTLTGIPKIELEEVNALRGALAGSSKQEALGGIIALTAFVGFLYEELARRLEKDSSLTAKRAFADIIAEQNRLLFAMEDHYYTNLRPNFPRFEAIRRIRDFLEEQVG